MPQLPSGSRILRVIVAEDVLLTRRGIVTVLREAGVDVVDEVADAGALIASTDRHRPDAVVTDIRMPPTGTREGVEAAQRIRHSHPQIGVLVLSQYLEPAYAIELISEHPSGMGYLLKERVYDAALVVDALRRLTEGETVVDPTIVSRLFGRRRVKDPLDDLTERERDVLALVAEGMSNRAIAERLSITERTVEAHVTQIFQKLLLEESPGSHRRVLAVLAFLRT